MARVTVEDCIEKTEGVFSLIKLASQRARRIANGAETLLEDEENDKPTVLALREIAEGHLDNPEFHKTQAILKKSWQKNWLNQRPKKLKIFKSESQHCTDVSKN